MIQIHRCFRLVIGLSIALACVLPATLRAAAQTGVVGTGTPESCTEAALDFALASNSVVTFNCGGPKTITIS